MLEAAPKHRSAGRERARQLDEELIAEGRGKDPGPARARASAARAGQGSGTRAGPAGGRARDGAGGGAQPQPQPQPAPPQPQAAAAVQPLAQPGRAAARRREDDGRKDRNLPPPPPMLDKPEQFGVYRGRVSNVMEFGCFVELLGFRTKAEGLVHLANMAKTRRARRRARPRPLLPSYVPSGSGGGYCVLARSAVPPRRVASARDVVKRGQDVWVKVISTAGQKISLSMRDVDQVAFYFVVVVSIVHVQTY